jgi:DNA primase
MLEALSIRNVQRATGEEALFSCPFPEHRQGDENPSAYMNLVTTAYMCHGCKRRGNAVTFLADLEEISNITATRFLRERYDTNFREPEKGSAVAEWETYFAKDPDPIMNSGPEAVDEAWIDSFQVDWQATKSYLQNHDQAYGPGEEIMAYMFERGFTPETLEEWDMGYDGHADRFTIPIRDADKTLVGFKGRSHDPERTPKYIILGGENYGFDPYPVSSIVFGLDKVESPCESLIVCEGELNVIAMHQKGYTNAVALGGSNHSERQHRLLRSHCDHAILFFDSDHAGFEATARTIELLQPFMRVSVIDDHEGDPANMTPSEVRDCVENPQSSLQFLL